ncbi:hypothetical protein ABZU76_03015 [Amycolatopsis sp. NPDC005232]|uniref:hypothetical protein n=1 Tax=Amycolatopsis sp. NPDC005232 TaxID=3157027 RepID=UPI0033AD773F
MTAPEPRTAPVPWWARYAKGLLALAGSVPPVTVFAWLDSVGVHAVPPWLQALITGVCAVAAVVAGPKNVPKV